MSVFREKDRRCFRYEFQFKGKTYKGSTGQITREDAEAFEFAAKQKLHRQAGGLIDLRDAPAFSVWSGVYYTHKAEGKHKVKRPEQIDVLVRVALQFFGQRPTDPTKVAARAPYHDLTLADPIVEPDWLDRFEDWMTAQNFSGSHCNHLRTQISGMYRVAMLPRFRKVTGVTMNPMVGVPRDRRVSRHVTLTLEQIATWIASAGYHIRLALAIAALAPKLRVANILALRWDEHVDRTLTRIVVRDHKTDSSGRPLVAMISKQLRAILEDARGRSSAPWIVAYRKKQLRHIHGGVKAAAERAGIPYGRGRVDGATFHTIRHAMASLFAQMPALTEPRRAALMAHDNIQTTQIYTHLNPVTELEPLEALSAQLPIVDLVTQSWRRWTPKRALSAGGEAGGPPDQAVENPSTIDENAATQAVARKRRSAQ